MTQVDVKSLYRLSMNEQMKNKVINFAQIADTAFVVARTFMEPIHSAFIRLGSRDKGRLGEYIRTKQTKKDENFPKFFNHHYDEVVEFLDLSETPKLLNDIDDRLVGKEGNSQDFIGDALFSKWKLMSQMVCEGIGERIPGITMTDYVASTPDSHSLFFVQGDQLKEVKIGRGDTKLDINGIEAKLHEAKTTTILPDDNHLFVNLEIAIEESLRSDGLNTQAEVRRISSITNDFDYKRHARLEREGLFFTGLRHMGVHSLGELQNESRVLFDQGWQIDPNSQEIKVDEELMKTWLEIRNLPNERFENETVPNQVELAEGEAREHVLEQAYYQLVLEKLNGSELVRSFVESDVYKRFSIEFCDRHAASYGATDMKVARSMLAGMYMFAFEGVDNPDQSPSQHYMAPVKGYHESLMEYMSEYDGDKPRVPNMENGGTMDEKVNIFKDLLNSVDKDRLEQLGLTEFRYTADQKRKALHEAITCMEHARGEMYRNPVHREVIEIFHRFGLIASGGRESRVGMGDTFIGNLMLRTVDIHGEKRFAFPWLKRASGYLGPDREKELPLVAEASEIGIDDVMRDIFSGKVGDEGHPYLSQEARIFKHSGTILKYLMNNETVPVSVRKFVSSLSSTDAVVRVLQTMGNISDNDPNIINRFFPDGIGEFHLASVHRYLFDFVRGVESNLVLGRKDQKFTDKVGIWAGNWRNRDFSGLDSEAINTAVKETLKDGHSRLLELNHAVGDINKMVKALGLSADEMKQMSEDEYRTTWKTIQEEMEVVFGWDTTAMKYLRWQEMWNVWHTLGAAWDCICFTRKTIFNPKILKATY